MYYPNVKTNMGVSTTIIELSQMILLPSQQSKKKRSRRTLQNERHNMLRCKKAGYYSNECKEKLPKTSGGKNGICMLINIDDSSDKESVQEDQYKSDGDRR